MITATRLHVLQFTSGGEINDTKCCWVTLDDLSENDTIGSFFLCIFFKLMLDSILEMFCGGENIKCKMTQLLKRLATGSVNIKIKLNFWEATGMEKLFPQQLALSFVLIICWRPQKKIWLFPLQSHWVVKRIKCHFPGQIMWSCASAELCNNTIWIKLPELNWIATQRMI